MKSLREDKQELLQGQMNLIDFLEEYNQEVEADVRGLMDDGYCPKCGTYLEDLATECSCCHQKLSWNLWKKINNYGVKEW